LTVAASLTLDSEQQQLKPSHHKEEEQENNNLQLASTDFTGRDRPDPMSLEAALSDHIHPVLAAASPSQFIKLKFASVLEARRRGTFLVCLCLCVSELSGCV
jgi:hypothetical protein